MGLGQAGWGILAAIGGAIGVAIVSGSLYYASTHFGFGMSMAMGSGEALTRMEKLPPKQAILIMGPPGIGKTSLGKALADRIGAQLEVIDLNSHVPEDLSGYPFPNPGEGTVDRLPEKWMRRLSVEEIGDRPGVLILDDISQAGKNMQAAVFRVALERKAGDLELGPNVRVVMTANLQQHKAGAGPLLSPLISRSFTYELTPDLESWIKLFALPKGIDKKIIAYLKFKPQNFSKLPVASQLDPRGGADVYGRFPSPRGWEFLSNAIAYGVEPSEMFETAAAFLGEGVAVEFSAFYRTYEAIPDPVELLNNPEAIDPGRKLDEAIAIMTAVVDAGVRTNAGAAKILKAIGIMGTEIPEMATNAMSYALSAGLDTEDFITALSEVPEIQPLRERLNKLGAI